MTSLGRPTGRPTGPRAARACSASIPGCQHVLGNTPCQDASLAHIAEDRVILAVSDGHGDAQYTHSDEGARIAVAVALDVLNVICDQIAQTPIPSPDDLLTPLKRRIAFEWNRRVKHHARMVAAVAARDRRAERGVLGESAEGDQSALLWPDEVTGDWDEKVKVYGATLIAVAATEASTVWLRIGDGDAIAIATEARRIFTASDKSMGQATFSLSMRNSIDHIDVVVEEPSSAKSQELIVLATDGVVDQYESDPSFEDEWGTKMLDRIRTKGWTETMMDIPRHLGTVARDGDDCSVAIAWFEENENKE